MILVWLVFLAGLIAAFILKGFTQLSLAPALRSKNFNIR